MIPFFKLELIGRCATGVYPADYLASFVPLLSSVLLWPLCRFATLVTFGYEARPEGGLYRAAGFSFT